MWTLCIICFNSQTQLVNDTLLSSTHNRLNFDYDMRRSSEDGPWIDLIPFDARDVWRFVVTFDDRYEVNMWWADKNSFMNMGRDHRPRCWPWAKGDILPFNRKTSDMPITGHGPNGKCSNRGRLIVSVLVCDILSNVQLVYEYFFLQGKYLCT